VVVLVILHSFVLLQCDQAYVSTPENSKRMEEFCKHNGFIHWYDTSAKDNINIDEAANCLISKVTTYLVKYIWSPW